MTVAQLIDYLDQFPPDTRVFLLGEHAHESGVDPDEDFIVLEAVDFE